MAAGAKVATIVWLYVRIITASNGGEDSRTAFADMAACQQALHSVRVAVSSGGDAENAVVMWCGGTRDMGLRNGEWRRQTMEKPQ